MDLWTKCQGINHITRLQATAWRLVEAQYVTATRKLVDSLDEQEILEELIESTKPPISKEFFGLHPLLYTSFRYPPLKYGSRFGTRYQHSLWYGSLELSTSMAEKAYYQFNFLRASKADFGIVELWLTAFSVDIKTARGVQLTKPPFTEYQPTISSPTTYQISQQLGSAMRKANIEAFNYQSARDPKQGVNMALFTPKVFARKNPNEQSLQSWQCVATDKRVEFIRSSAMTAETQSFPVELFLVDGTLPFPAY